MIVSDHLPIFFLACIREDVLALCSTFLEVPPHPHIYFSLHPQQVATLVRDSSLVKALGFEKNSFCQVNFQMFLVSTLTFFY